jgi:hypothetical protein
MNERRSSDTGRMKTAFIGKRIANSVGNKESMIALTVYQPFIHTTLPPVKRKEFLKYGHFTLFNGKVTVDKWPKVWELRMGRSVLEVKEEYLDPKLAEKFYLFFCEEFLGVTCTLTVWNAEKENKKLSDIANLTDEAMTKLQIENSYHVWMKMAKYE